MMDRQCSGGRGPWSCSQQKKKENTQSIHIYHLIQSDSDKKSESVHTLKCIHKKSDGSF